MATLTGKRIAATYTSLLKLEGDSGSTQAGASGDAVQVKTGDDDATALYLNTDRVGIGINTPTATLEVQQGSSGGVVAFKVDNDDVDKVAVSIEAANTTANVMDITSDAATTGHIINITADALTTGSVLYIDSDSSSTSTRNLVNIIQNNGSASGAVALRVQQDSAADIINVFDGSTEVFTILNGGNVGIGTTTPAAHLTISDATTDAQIMLTRGTYGTADVIETGDVLGSLLFNGFDADYGDANTYSQGAIIRAETTDNWDTDDAHQAPTAIKFFTQDNSNDNTLGSSRMIIDANGYIGIGTASPTGNLDIVNRTASGTSSGAVLRLGQDDTTVAVNTDRLGVIEFRGAEDTGATMTVGARIEAVADATWSASENGASLDFYTQRMTILADGKVGIGIANPGSTLHVNKLAMSSDTYNIINVTGTGAAGTEAAFEAGVYYHSSQYTTDSAVTYMKMEAPDGVHGYIWMDNNDLIKGSTSSSNIGTTGGIALSAALSSDERLKDIGTDSFPYGLSEINKLTPIQFSFKAEENARNKLGFGAQTIQSIIPETVYDTNECIHGYNYEKVEGSVSKSIPKGDPSETKLVMEYHQIIPVLVKAVQELSAKVTALENA